MPSDRSPLTQARLKELLHYDPETGHFTWRVRRSGAIPAGRRAGTVQPNGYRYIGIDNSMRFEHRVAFLYMTGAFPPDDLDHINRDPTDNRWSNLRPATRSQNCSNTKLRSDNSSGARGVTRRGTRWIARGQKDGKRVEIGRFSSLGDAAKAVEEWRAEHHGVFAASAGHPNPETGSL